MNTVLLAALRMSALLGLLFLALAMLRHRSAALRAWIVASALAGAALIPVLEAVAPAWGTPIAAAAALPGSDASVRLLLVVWAGGAAIHLLVLIAGMIRLMGVAAAADPIRDGRWADLALDIAAEYRVHAPVLLLEADRATLPVTWGHRQPKVLLPPAAQRWSDERARVVLRHELAHVRRRDWLVQLFATIVRSLYWFHPLVWLACARLRLESERACDDAVLRGGVSGPRYASHLLELARGFVPARPAAFASSLATRSSLQVRVRAMLDMSNDRSQPRTSRCALAAAAFLVVAVATAGFGAPVDPPVQNPVPAPRRLTLLLDGRIVDLSKEWPSYPNPRAGLVAGPGWHPELQMP